MSKDWKEVLLRSGVPLEYEVAQILAELGFEVDADFPYLRQDVGGEKEHSIDILGSHFLEVGKKKKESATIFALVECKYRSPEKKLLLFEAPPSQHGWTDARGAVQAYDEFVPFMLMGGTFHDLEDGYDVVYKGVEIHSNDAVERDFRRSVEQLRYAAPVCLRRALDMTFFGHVADNQPWFFAKIIVTNAKLMILRNGVDVAKVQAASKLEDVAEEIGAAILYSEYGPDFERHFKGVFADAKEDFQEKAVEVERYLRDQNKGVDFLNSPTEKMRDLCSAQRSVCRELSTQFFVCHVDFVGGLVEGIVEGAREAVKNRRKKRKMASS